MLPVRKTAKNVASDCMALLALGIAFAYLFLNGHLR
jgi:hypothetical protein